MDDMSAIQQVIVRYGNAVDDRDFDRMFEVFTPDVRASYGGGPWLDGVQPIIDHISGLRNFAASLHLFGNMEIDVDGDRASSVSRAMTYLVGQDNVFQARALRYRDKWQRTEAGWRINERVHSAQWTYAGTATMLG